MNKVAILTDSCSYIDAQEAQALDIHVVPLKVTLGDKTFDDGEPEITERYFKYQEENREPLIVSAPGVREFEKAYTQLHKKTDKILALHVSGRLSDTLKQSKTGAETLLGRCTIEMLDTNSILLGQGILVRAAAKAANEGASIDEIIRLIRGLIPRIYTVLYVETMEYLERSNTVGKAQAILGAMMGIKPMLFMEDGAVTPMEKVKTKEKAIDKLLEFVSEFDAIEQTAIFQRSLQTTPETTLLLERLRQLFPGKSFPILQYNPLLASYVGPEAMGVIVYEGESFF
jgi:DegV family protein with EDD domain